jgi:hypothetical protein
MDAENNFPIWVSFSQEHLKSIISKITVIKKEGQAEINRGVSVFTNWWSSSGIIVA